MKQVPSLAIVSVTRPVPQPGTAWMRLRALGQPGGLVALNQRRRQQLAR